MILSMQHMHKMKEIDDTSHYFHLTSPSFTTRESCHSSFSSWLARSYNDNRQTNERREKKNIALIARRS